MPLALSHNRHRLIRHRLAWQQRNRSTLAIAAMCVFGLLALLAVALTVAAIFGVIWFGRFAGALPPPDQLTARTLFQTTPIYAADETTRLFEITDPNGGRRTIVGLDQVPRSLIEATIATEDPSFFSNPGFEIRSIFRATLDDLSRHEVVSGASTITQQVVRNVLLSADEGQDLSARRKIREILLAYQLTHTYSKDEILQVYLNEINYGNRNYGIEAAAEGYFGKPAADLDLAECALLAGIPQAPGYYDPYLRLDEVKDRQSYVLQRMVIQGYITQDQADAAAAEPLNFLDRRHALVAPHFVTYVADLLSQQLGEEELYHGGDRVTTTLDLKLQALAEGAVRANLGALQASGGNNAAVVVLDPRDGRILALVGSVAYDDPDIAGEVDMALAPLSSGGILSPFTYALAFERGQTLLNRVDDAPLQLPSNGGIVLQPQDTHHYLGPVTLRQALGLGLDVPATRVMGLVGNQSFVNFGNRLGFPSFAQRVVYGQNFTIADARVSPLEVAEAYGALADGGHAHRPTAIERIARPNGQAVDGKSDPVGTLDPGAAYLTTTTLADPSVRPDNAKSLLDVGEPLAARLSLSDDHRSAWAVGYDANLVVVVWTGNSEGQPLSSDAPAGQIWSDFLRQALKLRPASPIAKPDDVVSVSLCKNPGCTLKEDQLALRGTEAAVVSANAESIAKPVAATGSSQTPLVDRAPAPGGGTMPVPAPGAATTVIVPDVAFMTPDEARTELSAAQLANTSLVQYVSRSQLTALQRAVPVGRVIATSPPSGERVSAGTSVLLIVRRS